MRCTIITARQFSEPCGRPVHRYIALAIGQNARMSAPDDALLIGYVPVCVHHSEYVPMGAAMLSPRELQFQYRPVPTR